MLGFKQGGMKYHLLCFWYNSTWDWNLVSQVTGEHSTPWQEPISNDFFEKCLIVIFAFYIETIRDKSLCLLNKPRIYNNL